MPEINPYHPLSPPDDPTLFYGREDAVAFLRQRLVGAHNRELLLILGRVGIGKTSLLYQTPYIVDERYHTVLVSLQPQHVENMPAFIKVVVDSILNRMQIIGASTYRVPEFPTMPETTMSLLNWFADEFLGVVLTAIRRDRYMLLMFDDFYLTYDAINAETLPANFMEYLGSLLTRHDRLDILAALDVDYEDRALLYSSTANVNFHYRLVPLSESESRQLIVEPVQDEYELMEDVIQQILKLAGGYPFLLHSICRLIYRYREGNKQLQLLGIHALESVYSAVLEETGEIMRPFWTKATPNERAVLLAFVYLQQSGVEEIKADTLFAWLQRSKVKLNQTQIASTLRSLEYDHLIKSGSEGAFIFNSGLEADWLRLNAKAPASTTAPALSPLTSQARMIGLISIAIVILIIGGLLAFGAFDGDDVIEPDDNAPATLTLAPTVPPTRPPAAQPQPQPTVNRTEEPGG